MRLFALSILLILFSLPAFAENIAVTGYQLISRSEGVVLRLQLNQMGDFKAFTLDNPNRLVVDVMDARWKGEAPKAEDKIGFVQQARIGRPDPKTFRFVLDLSKTIIVEDAFIQVPSRNGDPHYLVVQMKPAPEEKKLDLPTPSKQEAIKTETPTDKKNVPLASAAGVTEKAFIPIPEKKPKIFTIVIDAGHGGVDPGAIGALGTKEKDITLRYVKNLRDILKASGRYKVVLTRENNTYIPLRGRLKKAQAAKGDLFLSLHADTHPEATMQGLSVYTLSENASDKEAEALAERENKRDIITGVDLSGQSKDVTQVLIDLAQRETNNTSARFAELVVAELGTEARLLKNTHRFAGFAVLKGVGVPSALIELGYLSNPKEEKQLVDPDYQDKLVNAIARAIDTYCDQYVQK